VKNVFFDRLLLNSVSEQIARREACSYPCGQEIYLLVLSPKFHWRVYCD